MKVTVSIPAAYGNKVEVEGSTLASREQCETLSKAIMSAADIVWPIEPPKDITKEKNGAGNNKK